MVWGHISRNHWYFWIAYGCTGFGCQLRFEDVCIWKYCMINDKMLLSFYSLHVQSPQGKDIKAQNDFKIGICRQSYISAFSADPWPTSLLSQLTLQGNALHCPASLCFLLDLLSLSWYNDFILPSPPYTSCNSCPITHSQLMTSLHTV